MTHSVTHSLVGIAILAAILSGNDSAAQNFSSSDQTRPKDTKAAPIKAADFADRTEIIARSGLAGPPSLSCFFASHARAGGAADAPRHDEVCGRFRQTIDLWAADTWRLMVELTNQKKKMDLTIENGGLTREIIIVGFARN